MNSLRVGLHTRLESTLGRTIYRAVSSHMREDGLQWVRGLSLAYPLEDASPEHLDVLIAPVTSEWMQGELEARGLRVINFANSIWTDTFFQVVNDQRAIGAMAAEYLSSQGKRIVGLASGVATTVYAKERKAGFREAWAGLGHADPVLLPLTSLEEIRDTLPELLRRQEENIEAIYFVSDMHAATAILTLEEAGWEVPRQISIMGTDHEEMIQLWLGRGLTSIVLDFEGIALEILEVLRGLQKDPDLPSYRRLIPPLEIFTGETVQRPEPEDPRLRRAMSLLYSEQLAEVDLEKMARAAHMSRRGFEMAFAREVGLSPGAAILEARMQRAKRSLAETNMSIDAIAELCGYASRHHFSNRFKQESGFSPAVYRKRCQRR